MARKWPQFLASICICFGAMCTGIMIGWPNTIDPKMRKGEYDLEVNDTEMAIIGSSMTLGAALTCFPVGFLLNIIGRKWTVLLTIVPFTLGWALIIFAKGATIIMIYVGRFILGLAGGTFCIGAPLYMAEIAQNEIRGMLGTFFQLFITIGILVTFITGWVFSLMLNNIVSAIIPFIFFFSFLFQPESPIIIVKKGKLEKAQKVFKYFRGQDFEPGESIKQIQTQLEEEKLAKQQFKQTMKKKNAKKATLICFVLMFYQQFSGINAVMFYSSSIFEAAKSSLESAVQSIIIGVLQIIITLVAAFTIDKFGRKILLMLSAALMGLSLVVLGVFFTLKERIYGDESNKLDSLGWLPLTSLCIYIMGFSIGFGPIPWMASAEIFPPEIKATMAAAAGTLNWLFAFVVSMLFPPLKGAIGGDICFYFFGINCLISIAFILFVMPETKNKSFEEIQAMLGGGAN